MKTYNRNINTIGIQKEKNQFKSPHSIKGKFTRAIYRVLVGMLVQLICLLEGNSYNTGRVINYSWTRLIYLWWIDFGLEFRNRLLSFISRKTNTFSFFSKIFVFMFLKFCEQVSFICGEHVKCTQRSRKGHKSPEKSN